MIIKVAQLIFYGYLILSFLQFVNYKPKEEERLGESIVSALFSSQQSMVTQVYDVVTKFNKATKNLPLISLPFPLASKNDSTAPN
jgi:hypothetical protein